AHGQQLSGIIDWPDAQPRADALFADCLFTPSIRRVLSVLITLIIGCRASRVQAMPVARLQRGRRAMLQMRRRVKEAILLLSRRWSRPWSRPWKGLCPCLYLESMVIRWRAHRPTVFKQSLFAPAMY
ncbi:MAG: hypothetical protein ACI8W7_004757, partial [Gammaproteobacteria bacterium]